MDEADLRLRNLTYELFVELAVELHGGRPSDESLVFHCLVPAAHWWDDIAYT